jgi:hypothetical protein
VARTSDSARRSSARARAALSLAIFAATPSAITSSTSVATVARTTRRQRTFDRTRAGAVARRVTTASLTIPLSTASTDSSSQILSSNPSQVRAWDPSGASRSAPPTLIDTTGRNGWRLLNSSTSVLTHRGSSSVPRLAMTTSVLARWSAARSAPSRRSPGGASSSLKNTVKSRSRRRRARSEA